MTNTEKLEAARQLTADLLALLEKMCAEECDCGPCELVRQGTARAVHFANNLAYAMLTNLNGCLDQDWTQANEGLAIMEKSATTLTKAVADASWATRRLETMSWLADADPAVPSAENNVT